MLIVLIFLSGACTGRKGSQKISVVTSIGIIGGLVTQVGGERVDLTILIPPNSNPHIFEPSPSQIKALHDARLIVFVGLNLEFWKDKVLESADNPRVEIVTLADGIDIIEDSCHLSHSHQSGGNPHIWLSPRNAMIIIEKIRDGLIKIDSEEKEYYYSRAERYIAELKKLDEAIVEKVKGFSSKKFIAHHPAWVYFAKDYGLEQAAVIESTPGREPSPAELKIIIENAEKIGAKAVFAERQFSSKAAEVIAHECRCSVLYLDPLGKPPDFDYIECMRKNVEEMEKALK